MTSQRKRVFYGKHVYYVGEPADSRKYVNVDEPARSQLLDVIRKTWTETRGVLKVEAYPRHGQRESHAAESDIECNLLVFVGESLTDSRIHRVPIRLDSRGVPAAIHFDGSDIELSAQQSDAVAVAISTSIAGFSQPGRGLEL